MMKILVLSDIHLGYEDSVSGFFARVIFRQTLNDLEKIFKEAGEVEVVIILGDVKHYFGKILDQEWSETRGFFDYLKKHCKKIVVVKGNHDNILEPISKELGFGLADYYIIGKYGFLHGDKMFTGAAPKEIKVLFLGHLHPAVTLREGVKSERYKCFLVGKWKRKRIIVLPSFFPLVEGVDIAYWEGDLCIEIDISMMDVYAVGEDGVYGFGKMGKLSVMH